MVGRDLLRLKLVRCLALLDLVPQVLHDQVGVLHCLSQFMQLLPHLFALLAKIALKMYHFLGQIAIAAAFPTRYCCIGTLLQMHLQALNIAHTRLHLHALGLHYVPHLLKQLPRFCLELAQPLVLLIRRSCRCRKGRLRSQYELGLRLGRWQLE